MSRRGWAVWSRLFVTLIVSGALVLCLGMVLAATYVSQRYPTGPDIRENSGLVGVQFSVPNWLLRWSIATIFLGTLLLVVGWTMSGAHRGGMPDVAWPRRQQVVGGSVICVVAAIIVIVVAVGDGDGGLPSMALAASMIAVPFVVRPRTNRHRPE